MWAQGPEGAARWYQVEQPSTWEEQKRVTDKACGHLANAIAIAHTHCHFVADSEAGEPFLQLHLVVLSCAIVSSRCLVLGVFERI